MLNDLVKKTSFEGILTFSALRFLFVEKFNYSHSQDTFPRIAVRQPGTQIFYELESVSDVQENCILKLVTPSGRLSVGPR